jgi:uncharacterized protein YcfJ
MPSDKNDLQEQHNVLVGMGAGGAAAATAGAVIGAVTGGPIGAIAGASLGGFIGSVSGGALAYGDVEPEFRRHYEASSTTSRGSQHWESISPAYQYGWESRDRAEYQGKSWDQVHSDLEKGWTGGGQWADHAPHARIAWERRAQHLEPSPAADSAPIPEEISKDHELFQGADGLASIAIGGTSGAYLGGVMGLLVGGPIGMAVGGTIGTVAGAAIAHGATSDWHEPAFKAQHEALENQHQHSWEQAGPAYKYGWDAHDQIETGSKTWEEARHELEKGWKGPGRYADFEPYIKNGWEKRLPEPSQPRTSDGA